jgi:hypothetical protein
MVGGGGADGENRRPFVFGEGRRYTLPTRLEFMNLVDVDLTALGNQKAEELAQLFTTSLDQLEEILPPGRERSLVVTKLQETHFWAVRALVSNTENVAQ